jgi:hypothetical protein
MRKLVLMQDFEDDGKPCVVTVSTVDVLHNPLVDMVLLSSTCIAV